MQQQSKACCLHGALVAHPPRRLMLLHPVASASPALLLASAKFDYLLLPRSRSPSTGMTREAPWTPCTTTAALCLISIETKRTPSTRMTTTHQVHLRVCTTTPESSDPSSSTMRCTTTVDPEDFGFTKFPQRLKCTPSDRQVWLPSQPCTTTSTMVREQLPPLKAVE